MKRYLIILLTALLAACGGNDTPDSKSPTAARPAVQNSVAATVDDTFNSLDRLYVTVTVCQPGTSNCQDVDHVLVDTGSSGLRLFSTSAVQAAGLPLKKNAAGDMLGECMFFTNSFMWGGVHHADVHIGGEVASNAAIQVVSDPALPAPPDICVSSGGASQNTPQHAGANGILGISPRSLDCGSACMQSSNRRYFSCPPDGSSCTNIALQVSEQVANPAQQFAQDNNGVIVQLPSLPSGTAPTADGSLTFGLGTQANNGLRTARILTLSSSLTISTLYKGTIFPDSTFDTGTPDFGFSDSTLPLCPGGGFYCPGQPLAFSAMVSGVNGIGGTVDFDLSNPPAASPAQPAAISNLGHAAALLNGKPVHTAAFFWGLPFFFGRTVGFAYQNAQTPFGPGPFYAF
jgi:hypothetical protein